MALTLLKSEESDVPLTAVWRLRLVAIIKAVVGLIFGFGIGIIGLFAYPVLMSKTCYKNHGWPWEIE